MENVNKCYLPVCSIYYYVKLKQIEMSSNKIQWFKCIETHPWYKKGEYYKTDGDFLIISDVKGCFFNGNASVNSTVKKYFKKLYTLQDLRDGKCAVENNLTDHDLRLVLQATFDYYGAILDGYGYVARDLTSSDDTDFIWLTSTDLPCQDVEDFLPQIENNEEFPRVGVTDKPTWFSEFPVKPRPPHKDNVEPNHYGGKENPLEVIKIIQHYNLSFELGNVLKYIIRHDKKGASLQDLQKAKKYLEFEISKYN